MVLQLTALVFSGRVNPTWCISGDACRQLSMRLTRLGPLLTPYRPSSRLGYAGIQIETTSPTPTERWLCFEQTVRHDTESGTTWHADPGRELEHSALMSGQDSLDPDLFQKLITFS